MKKKVGGALLTGSALLLLFFLWWSKTDRDSPDPKTGNFSAQVAEQTSKKLTPKSKPAGITPVRRQGKEVVENKSSENESPNHKQFMRELDKLEYEVHEQTEKCFNQIEGRLDDLDFIDPQSEFYENVDKVEDLLHNTLVHMSSGAAQETSWLIQDYIQENEPPDIKSLINAHSRHQENCLLPSGVTFIQTAIESCRYNCPPRLKGLIGNVVFDGLPLVLSGFSGSHRLLFALSVMDTANRYGPFHISMGGEIEDLRFRVQQNYEIFNEELEQNEGKPGRLAVAFRKYIEENEYLKEELINHLKNAGMRYYP